MEVLKQWRIFGETMQQKVIELLVFRIKQIVMIEKLFFDSVIKRFKEYKRLGEKTFDQLNDEEMHFQPNQESNSIAIIIQHLNGNMVSRWTNFLSEDGEKEW